ncbi:MAG: single-stranded DNA-binding protein [Dethiobacteria bacterium]|nr:single-stranded DNA-binding protein [Dethiobacteria bacterium]
MLNQVVLIGRLTRDPELRYTAGSGIPVASFSLAVDRPFTNQQGERETDFINIVTWRKQAENVANYLKKGSLAAVAGRLQIRSYDDTQGVKRKVAEVVADNVRFLDRGRSAEQGQVEAFDIPGDEIDNSGDDVPF